MILCCALGTLILHLFPLTNVAFFGSGPLGDITQIDLDGKESGLVHAAKILDNVEGVGVCRLTAKDVVRHKCRLFFSIYAY